MIPPIRIRPLRHGLVAFVAIAGAFVVATRLGDFSAGESQKAPRASARSDALRELGLPFVPNRGQTDASVAYTVATRAGGLLVSRDGLLVHAFRPGVARGSRTADATSPGATLTETFVGGRARPTAGAPAGTRVSLFLGDDPERWQPHLSAYRTLSLGAVWPGIEVQLEARGGGVEKTFTVQPAPMPPTSACAWRARGPCISPRTRASR